MKAVTETPIVSTKPHVNMPASELDRIFEEGLSNHEELSVVRTLVDNIKNRSVLLYGQGIYDRTTKKIGHIEVLARLSDGERVFSPFLFLSFVKKF